MSKAKNFCNLFLLAMANVDSMKSTNDNKTLYISCFPLVQPNNMFDSSKMTFSLLLLSLLMVSTIGGVRIHGGEEAEEGEFPYIISIRRIANAFQHM